MVTHFSHHHPRKIFLLASSLTAIMALTLLVCGIVRHLASPSDGNPVPILAILLATGFMACAAWKYWTEGRRALILQAGASIGILILMPFARNEFDFRLFLILSGLDILTLLGMMIHFRVNRVWIALLVGITLAAATFFIQRMGPSTASYGTECPDQPGGLCIGPVLGAGFPMQYVLDFSGGSVVGRIGFEDHISPLLFLVDAAFFTGLIYAILWLWKEIGSKIFEKSNEGN